MNDSATVAQLIKERMKINGVTNKKLAESIKNVNVNCSYSSYLFVFL